MSALTGVGIGLGILVLLVLVVAFFYIFDTYSFVISIVGIVLLLVAGVIGGIVMIINAVHYDDGGLAAWGTVITCVSGFLLFCAFLLSRGK